MKSLVSPSFLKQKARQLKKEKSLSQSEAYDEAARQSGYTNYKNYRNLLKAKREQSKSAQESLLKNIYSEKDMSKKVGLAISFIQSLKEPFQKVLDVLLQFQDASDVQYICEKSSLKEDIQVFLHSYFLTEEAQRELKTFPNLQYFLVKDVSVKNLKYKIEGNMLLVDGDYDLTFESEFEMTDELKKLPHFNRQPMFGDFEITIDENKKITIENQTIGEEIDGRFFWASFG